MVLSAVVARRPRHRSEHTRQSSPPPPKGSPCRDSTALPASLCPVRLRPPSGEAFPARRRTVRDHRLELVAVDNDRLAVGRAGICGQLAPRRDGLVRGRTVRLDLARACRTRLEPLAAHSAGEPRHPSTTNRPRVSPFQGWARGLTPSSTSGQRIAVSYHEDPAGPGRIRNRSYDCPCLFLSPGC